MFCVAIRMQRQQFETQKEEEREKKHELMHLFDIKYLHRKVNNDVLSSAGCCVYLCCLYRTVLVLKCHNGVGMFA